MIQFKTDKVRREWKSGKLDRRLCAVVGVLAWYMVETFQVVLVITSIFRQGDKGVHGHWRGVDVRTSSLPTNGAAHLAEFINQVFYYDMKRPHLPVALHHNVGLGDHLHLQVAAIPGKWSLVA